MIVKQKKISTDRQTARRPSRAIVEPEKDGMTPTQKIKYTLTSYDRIQDVPFKQAYALLVEHGKLMHSRMVEGGGPDFDFMLHVDAFWEKIDTVLPPNGRYYLAWTSDGQLVGTGALRKVSDEMAEFKHLYVRSQARGAGVGRALVKRRMEDARSMGLRTIVADTFAANVEMPALYDRMGFQRVAPSELSATAGVSPELVDHMLFFRLDI